ncbi:retrovirus-related pol polyprotein from transposon TNT 1-94 [Tanacetum coccineum]
MDPMISLGQKNTLAEYMILSGADNRPPMLDKDLYDSWKSRMEFYMQNIEHKRMILESVEHGPLIWPTVEDNEVIRTKKYAKLSAAEKIQADCDMKAINIILQGLPADIYSLMKMEQFQVNTKFLNSLPPEWSKFMTDAKFVKDLHTSNFDQLHAYLEQHKLHANEVRIMRERNQDPLAFVANQQMTPPHFNTYQSSYNNPQLQQQFSPSHHASIQPNQHYSSHYPSQTQFNHSSIPPSHTYQSQMNHQTSTVPQVIPQVAYQSPQAPTQLMTESPFVDSGFAVPVFSLGDDPIACLNKAMAFLTAVASSRFPTTNNQLRTSSNPRNQATIQDGRVTVQQVQGRQGQNYSGNTYKSNATSSRGNTTSGQARVVKCYNCQGNGKVLNKEELEFLADPGVAEAKAVLMANLSSYGSDVLSEYLLKTQNEAVQDTNSSTQQDAMILSVFEQLSNQVTNCNKVNKDNLIANESLSAKLKRYKEREKKAKNIDKEIALENKVKELDNIVCKMGQSVQTMHMLTKPQVFYDKNLKQALGFQNPFYLKKAQQIRPILYDGSVIVKETNAPRDLPKVSLVNTSLKKLKYHLGQFDNVVKKQITPDALTEAKWGKFKGKDIVENAAQVSNTTTIAPGIYKLDTVTLAPKDKNNRETHIYYLKHTMEQAVILSEIVEQAKSLNHLYSASYCASCAMGKSKKQSHKPKSEDTNQEKLYLLHMDLCGPMRVASINGEKYILVIMDDYSQFIWVKFLASKDEAPDFIINFLKMIQSVGISHETSVARSPQQNGVVERQNRTLVEATRTMLIYAKLLYFYGSRKSLLHVIPKTDPLYIVAIPYELLHDRKPDLSYLHVFRALCYPNNDSEDLGKLQAKADIGIFIGYAPKKKAYRIYNRHTRKIIETIYVDFDELTVMASAQIGSGPGLQSCNIQFRTRFEESPKTPHFHDDPLHESLYEDSTSQGSSNVRPIHTPFKSLGRWTKDYPIANVIEDPSHSVSTRKQLQTDAMWCYFDAFLTSIEPKNFKQAMTKPSWIDAMQEEIHEFERLQVWELVSCQDKVMLIKLKWIYKVKTDEFGGDNPSLVYKLKKALYGLKQALRAWYDMMSSFFISQHFSKGVVDPTLFTQKAGNDLLLVQIYVDDIVFASTNTAMCNKFANMMTTKFKMSMIGHMSFFLGLQISQSPRGIFLNQSKYAFEIIKKYGLLSSDSVDTPMVEKNKLDEDLQGTPVDATLYHGMIGSLH